MRPSAPHLVGVDFSDGSARALRCAARLALTAAAPLHVVHADADHATVRERALEVLETDLRAFVKRTFEGTLPGVRFEYAVVHDLSPGLALSTYAEEAGARLLVVGTHGRRGVRRLLLGSVAAEAVRTAPCPVLTIPAAPDAEPSGRAGRPVLAPVDFSTASAEGVHVAHAWAARLGAPLVLLHVVDAGPYPAFYLPEFAEGYDLTHVLDERARARLPRFYRRAMEATGAPEPSAVPEIATAVGRADVEIAAYAKEVGARLIVMATRGLSGLEHVLLGSTTERVLRRAPCPVLTIRPRPETDAVGADAAPSAETLLETDLPLP